MTRYVAVPVAMPVETQAVVRRKRADPATYGLNDNRQRTPNHWKEFPIQQAVTPELPAFGLRTFTIRKVG